MVARVAVEAAVVGVVFAALLLLASLMVRLQGPWTIALAGWTAGVLGHLAFEALGANAWYCTNGAACMAL